jgi:hypothetical protein
MTEDEKVSRGGVEGMMSSHPGSSGSRWLPGSHSTF